MKKYICILCMFGALLTACQQEQPQKPEQMVLEAWIDADGYPIVLIHKSYVLANAPDSVREMDSVIVDQLIPFGRVAIFDGENEVVLTGRLDTFYFPPYTYTTVDMEGVVGKTYTVTATYNDLEATATTTIPPVASLDSIKIATTDRNTIDVNAYMTVNPDEEAYYLLYIRERGTKQYRLCPMGTFTNQDAVDGHLAMKVYNPLPKETDFEAMNYYFLPGDSAIYQLKIARVNHTEYLYWKAYSERIMSGGVLFVPIYSNLSGNVEGGMGIFTGMGSSSYRFNLLKDTVFRY